MTELLTKHELTFCRHVSIVKHNVEFGQLSIIEDLVILISVLLLMQRTPNRTMTLYVMCIIFATLDLALYLSFQL